MSDPKPFDPFDPISAAMGALHGQNLSAAKDARIKQLEADVERMTDEIQVYKEGVTKSDNLFKSIGIHVKDEEWVADGIAQLIDKVHATEEKVKRLTKATDAMHDVITIYSGWIRLPGDDPLRDAFNQVIDAMREADKS
mgnify:CR=1 FL=1